MTSAEDILARVTIRPWRDSDSFEELTALLHRAYKYLADRGMRFLASHQDAETTRKRVERGHCFVAELDGRIVGTITCYDGGSSKGTSVLSHPDVGKLGQLAVAPELQGHGLGERLFRYAEEFARSRNMAYLGLDTAETAEHLIAWYQRMGYTVVEYTQWDVTNYRSVVLTKKMD